MRFYHILANHNKSSDRYQSIVLYTHDHVQGNLGNVQSNIMCTYSQSRAGKEVSTTHHMYLLMVTCK